MKFDIRHRSRAVRGCGGLLPKPCSTHVFRFRLCQGGRFSVDDGVEIWKLEETMQEQSLGAFRPHPFRFWCLSLRKLLFMAACNRELRDLVVREELAEARQMVLDMKDFLLSCFSFLDYHQAKLVCELLGISCNGTCFKTHYPRLLPYFTTHTGSRNNSKRSNAMGLISI